jgi:hypothetical protein
MAGAGIGLSGEALEDEKSKQKNFQAILRAERCKSLMNQCEINRLHVRQKDKSFS